MIDAGLIDFRFHDLRHTTASYLAQSGATLLEIADVLGHKQIEVTKRYAHLCIEHKSSLINRVMGSIIGQSGGGIFQQNNSPSWDNNMWNNNSWNNNSWSY